MRDRQRLELKPDEYRDAKALERQQTLRELLAILRRAAAEGADWYTWALDARRRLDSPEPVPEPDPDSPFKAPTLPSRDRNVEPEQLRL